MTEKKAKKITLDPRNARTHPDRNRSAVEKSLRELGAGRSIVVDADGIVIGGNAVYEQAVKLGIPVKEIETNGDELIVVRRVDLATDDPRRKALALADNQIGTLAEWDEVTLEEIQTELLGEIDFDVMGFDEVGDVLEPVQHAALADRFIVPPFSVLDARQGYWQERKDAWISLGIRSEIGRGNEGDKTKHGLVFSSSAQPMSVYIAKNNYDAKIGHKSAWKEFYAANPSAGVQSGTSIFDPVLCELAYRWFSPASGVVLDPFAGGSVRGIVAAKCGREYVGVDLSEAQIQANEEQAATITPDNKPRWIVGDSRDIAELVPGEYDLVFTCPPYADLEVYSDDPRDLSTMEYLIFLDVYREIIEASVAMLKEDRFAVIVVGDVRDKAGMYRGFPAATIHAFEDAGAKLYNEAVLVTAIGSLAIRAGHQFSISRKLGKAHQNVLVFVKGDPLKAVAACGDVVVEMPEGDE